MGTGELYLDAEGRPRSLWSAIQCMAPSERRVIAQALDAPDFMAETFLWLAQRTDRVVPHADDSRGGVVVRWEVLMSHPDDRTQVLGSVSVYP